MPVYEYRCQQCQKVFEYQQRMADPAKTTCEECQGALERLISRSSFSFKGGGWYKDLYATPKDGGTAGGGGASTSTSTSTSTEAKSETKTETKSDSGSSGGGAGSAGSSSTAAAAPAK